MGVDYFFSDSDELAGVIFSLLFLRSSTAGNVVESPYARSRVRTNQGWQTPGGAGYVEIWLGTTKTQ